MTNYSIGEITNNTIIGIGGSDGIYINDNSDASIINNIVSNFDDGIALESSISTLSYNDLWANDLCSIT